MQTRAWALFVTVAVAATSARAQGSFQNLDFESARVIPIDNDHPWIIATSNALPYWKATYEGAQLTEVPYDGDFVPGVGLVGIGGTAIDGSFSVSIGGGSISQTGLVPADTRSLQFKVKFSGAVLNEIAEVWLGGERLPLVPLGAQQGYFLVGADIASFAGQTETLSFSGGSFALDDIEFSPQIVPEPSVLALAALGFATLLVFRRQRRSGLPSKGRRQGEQAGSPTNHAEVKREFCFLLCKLRKAILCAPAPLQRAMR